MGAPYTPISEASQWSQAALDMIEFAIGDASTPYGKRRAAAGHAAPFKLERVEVVRTSSIHLCLGTPEVLSVPVCFCGR